MNNILKDATLLDVRTPEEFSGGHYPGAVNIPLAEIQHRLEEVKAMKQPIVAYCRSGHRSGTAVSILQHVGIAEAYNGGGLSELLYKTTTDAGIY
jgi:phage shock protein E